MVNVLNSLDRVVHSEWCGQGHCVVFLGETLGD